MASHPLPRTDGLQAALAIHLGLYCAVAGAFALGLYLLLQPSRSANPGLAAYRPPAATVLTHTEAYTEALRSEPSRLGGGPVAALAPEPETTGASARDEIKKPAPEATPANSKRQRAARKARRSRPMDYAAQPFFGGFRPWY